MKTYFNASVRSPAIHLRLPIILKLLLLVFGASASDAPLAHAAHRVEERLSALGTKHFDWDTQQAMELSGVSVYVKSFSSALSPVQTAQTLAANSDLFQRVLTASSKIVLAGLQPNWHWLAEIEPTPNGAVGYVSALYVDSGRLSPGKRIDESTFQWLPSYAKRQFSQRTSEQSRTITQHIYSVSLAPQQLSTYVEQRLAALGWIKELAVTDTSDSSAWRRKDARLMLFPHASAAGTSLLVHYAE